MRLLPLGMLLLAVPAGFADVRIVPVAGGFQLLREGKPYFIKGAGGRAIASVASAGGNSIRTWGGVPPLEEAHRHGLSVLVGLDIGKPRHGFDYTDPQSVARQKEAIQQSVLRYKGHPAVLMWALRTTVLWGPDPCPAALIATVAIPFSAKAVAMNEELRMCHALEP